MRSRIIVGLRSYFDRVFDDVVRTKSATNMFYVYILKCVDNKTYVGCTDNLDDRLKRHQSGWVPATKPRLPVELVSYIVFNDKYRAYNFEKRSSRSNIGIYEP